MSIFSPAETSSVCILYTNGLVVNSGRAYIRVMTVIICEIAWAVAARANSASAAHRLRHAGATLPGLRWLDLYAPATAAANDPYVQDGPAPSYLAMFAFPSLADLDRAANTKTFASLVSSLPVLPCSAFRHLDFPIGDSTTPAPLTAPFSYVVRYHRPAEDEAAFVRNYLAGQDRKSVGEGK